MARGAWPDGVETWSNPRGMVTGRRGVLGSARCMGAEVRDAGFTRYVWGGKSSYSTLFTKLVSQSVRFRAAVGAGRHERG
jgi:hypothetical protein